MKKTNILVSVQKGNESVVLEYIRDLGYNASLLIGDYDIFVSTPAKENKQTIANYISQIPYVIKLAYIEDRAGELKYAS